MDGLDIQKIEDYLDKQGIRSMQVRYYLFIVPLLYDLTILGFSY